MSQNSIHKITICISCRHTGSDCRPGYELITRLRQAMQMANGTLGDDFEVSGIACMAGCDRPCTVAYHGSIKATYLFGDIDLQKSFGDLVVFARQYVDLPDAWCSSRQRPAGLSGKTLARVPAALPAALLVSQATAEVLS
ncbi:DUF1636 family protein [Hoeflea sp.]|uniref:DUF1636 family protein n=1 Tax=Hoeflea sp. TaxID=1940281 RepID=UPI003A907007